MAINKLTRAALKALSYPEIDVKKTYKINRRIQRLIHPPIAFSCKIGNLSFLAKDGYKIPARIFSPKDRESDEVLLFFHGGGWTVGDVESYTGTCASLCESTRRRVISVNYRLAPEFPFPYAVNDSYSALKRIYEKFRNVTVIGDSAGGNIAAVLSLMARDKKEAFINKQILIYPSTANNHSMSSPYPSIKKYGAGYLLTSKQICAYMDLYVQEKRYLNNPYFAPLLAEDLSNLPPTMLITAECDPLRDEGEDYAKRLWLAGNTVRAYRIKDALHGFFSLPATFEQVRKCHELIYRFLNDESIKRND